MRFRFGPFELRPGQRLLLREARAVPLIPRYFDLLVLLIERRHEAVHRRAIFDAVWPDVVVTDGALTQAVRSIRRVLEDDPTEPLSIRTVSRHGYQFVHPELRVEQDDADLTPPAPSIFPVASHDPGPGARELALVRLITPWSGNFPSEDEDRREAAESLHLLGTAEALRDLDRRPGHEWGRALLRDTRWDVASAGPVPILGQPKAFGIARALVLIRLRRAVRVVRLRWSAAAAGGAASGAIAGVLGGLLLWLGPGSGMTARGPVALGLVGALIGGIGAAGVGAGLVAAEALVRSFRGTALVLFGALGGMTVGALAHAGARALLEGLFGRDLSPVGGGFEGLVIGAGAGLGYALATPRAAGGMAALKGWAQLAAAVCTGACCALASLLLTWNGSLLGGVSLDYVAHSFPGSEVGLAPLARILGEPQAGPLTRAVLALWEGLMFGLGLALGLTRRPRLEG